MLKSLFTAIGGGIKDIQVAVVGTAEYIVDEVSSIPDALTDGYDKGLVTSSEPIEANAITPAPESQEETPAPAERKTFPATT